MQIINVNIYVDIRIRNPKESDSETENSDLLFLRAASNFNQEILQATNLSLSSE